MGFSAALAKLDRKIPGSKYVKVDHGTGFVHQLYDGVLAYGAGRAFGEIHGRYRDKAEPYGVPVNLGVGILAKVAVVAGAIATRGAGFFGMSTLNTIGTVGIGTYGFANGVKHGFDKSGRKAIVLDKGQPVPAGLATTQILGIPPAPSPGAFLDPLNTMSRDELADLAAYRG